MTDRFDPSLRFLAKELAPLEMITAKMLPPGLDERKALRVFLATVASSSPFLVHLPEFGLDLDGVRRFLSAFAGQRLEMPARRTLEHFWREFRLWLALLSAMQNTQPEESFDDVVKRVARRYGTSKRRLLQVYDTFTRTQAALKD